MGICRISCGFTLLFPFLVFAGADIASDTAPLEVETIQWSEAKDKRVRILENYLNAMQQPVSRLRGEGLLAVLRDDPAATAPLHLIRECIKSKADAQFFAAELAKLAQTHPGAPELTLAAVQIGDAGDLAPEVGDELLLAALQEIDDFNTLPPQRQEFYYLLVTEYASRVPLSPQNRAGKRWFATQLESPDSPWRDRILAAAAESETHEMILLREGAEKRLDALKKELLRREAGLNNDYERIRRGELYSRLGWKSDALRLAKQNAAQNRNAEMALQNIRIAMAAEGFSQAQTWLKEFREAEPQWNGIADTVEVEIALAQKNYDQAKKRLDALTESAWYDALLFQYYFQTKQFDAALKALREREKKDESPEEKQICLLGMLMIAEKQRNTVLLDEVAKKLDRSGDLYDPDFANTVGYIDAELNHNLKRAAELLERALAVDPDNPAYLDSMAWLQFRLGNPEEAEKWISKALSHMMPSPDLATLYEHAGDIQSALQKSDHALRSYRAALQYKPENPEAIQKKIAALTGK